MISDKVVIEIPNNVPEDDKIELILSIQKSAKRILKGYYKTLPFKKYDKYPAHKWVINKVDHSRSSCIIFDLKMYNVNIRKTLVLSYESLFDVLKKYFNFSYVYEYDNKAIIFKTCDNKDLKPLYYVDFPDEVFDLPGF